MKKMVVIILLLTMLGLITPAISFSTKVDAVEASSTDTPTNLIVGNQSTFEDTTSLPPGWDAFCGGTLSVSNIVAHSGASSLRLAERTQAWYSPEYNIYDIVKEAGAGIYTISLWVYTDTLSSSPRNGRLLIRGNAEDDNSFINYDSGSYYAVLTSSISTEVNTWTQYSATFEVLSGDITRASGTFNVCIDTLEGVTNQNVYLDDFLIYKEPVNFLSGTKGNFETASVPAGWSAFGGGTLTTSTTIAHGGSYSLKLAGRTQAWYSPQYNIYDILKAGGAGTYTIRFWVYVDILSSSPKNGKMLVRGSTADDMNSFITNNNGQYYGYLTSTISTPVSTWTQYSATLNVLSSDLTRATGTFNLMIDTLEGVTGQNLYFDDFEIIKCPSNGVYNGIFENPMALEGWNVTTFSGGTMTQYNTDKHTGNYSMKFTRPSVNTSAATPITPILNANGIGKYLLTFWAKLDTTATTTEPINAYFTNGANDILVANGTINKNTWTKFAVIVDIDTTELSQMTSSGVAYLHWTGAASNPTTTAFLIDDLNLTFPTDYDGDLLTNSGFEFDTIDWEAYATCDISLDNQIKNSGSYSCYVTDRYNRVDVSKQDITDALLANDSGEYSVETYIRLAEGYTSAKAQICIQTVSTDTSSGTNGHRWFVTPFFTLTSSGFTKLEGTLDVQWADDLSYAEFYINFNDNYTNDSAPFYIDDSKLTKVGFDEQSVDHLVERWRVQELSFTSSYADTTSIQESFEDTSIPAGYSAFGGGTLSTSTTVAHSGSRSLKLADRTQAWYSPAYNIYSALKSGGAGIYNVSFWVYVDALATSPSNGRIIIRGTSADQYSFFNSGQSYGVISNTVSTPVNTWTNYIGAVTITSADISGATGDFNLCMDLLPGVTGQNLYIDEVKVSKQYYSSPFNDVTMDVTFEGPNDTTMVMPAFWDGDVTWKVRFAPTYIGVWEYTTSCNDTSNTGLHNQTGTIGCVSYTGNLEIFQRGFVKARSGERYFSYNDGESFFYLGDTHWGMPTESFDSSTVEGIDSHFKYIVDDRVSKGFTVYQSEPIDANYNLRNGFSYADLAGFKDLDDKFEYIANAGLVHANAQLFFTSELDSNEASYSTAYLQKLSRYWVARYAAYPVMWTTAQETDDDYYGRFDIATSPWKTVFNAVHQYDPYLHPQTAHQENTGDTRAADSAYKDLAGYSWFSSQWAPYKSTQLDFSVPLDYWNYSSTRPAILYESFYENLCTNGFGERHQGWCAYLNGMYGYGYGVQDIWLYNTDYSEGFDTTVDGITITIAMKQVTWETSVNFDSSTQVGYMRDFFQRTNWWELIPRFDSTAWFSNNSSYYSVASKDNDVYVAYFYNTTTNTGTLKGMDNTAYTAKWFNPRTGADTTIGTITPSGGQYTIPAKPDGNDWVLYVYH